MVIKKPEFLFKSFTHALGDSDLSFFCSRFNYRYQGDMAEALNYLDTLKNEADELNPVAYLFGSAKTSDEFNYFVDAFSHSLVREYEKRGYRAEQLV